MPQGSAGQMRICLKGCANSLLVTTTWWGFKSNLQLVQCRVQRWNTTVIVLTPFDNKLLLPAPFQEDEGSREKLVCIAFLIPKGSAGIQIVGCRNGSDRIETEPSNHQPCVLAAVGLWLAISYHYHAYSSCYMVSTRLVAGQPCFSLFCPSPPATPLPREQEHNIEAMQNFTSSEKRSNNRLRSTGPLFLALPCRLQILYISRERQITIISSS